MGESRGALSSGSFPAFEKEGFQREPRADVLLEVTERVVRELHQPGPATLLLALGGEHAAPQLHLPAGQRKQRRILDLALAAPPGHLRRVELLGDVERHVGRGAEHLLEALRPVAVQLDDALIAGHAHRPAGPRASSARRCARSCSTPLRVSSSSMSGAGTGWKKTRRHRETTVGSTTNGLRLEVVRMITRWGCGSSSVLSSTPWSWSRSLPTFATTATRRAPIAGFRFRNACSDSSWNSGGLSGRSLISLIESGLMRSSSQ